MPYPDSSSYYAKRAAIYDFESSKREGSGWPQGEHIGSLLRVELGRCINGVMLDVGIGTGRLERLFTVPDEWLVVGVDASPEMASRAAGVLARRAGRSVVVVGDAHDLPIRSGSLDLILSISVLQYLRLGEAMLEMSRCLKHGGRFVIGVVVRHSRDTANWRRLAFLSDEHARVRQYHTIEDVWSAIDDAGMMVEESREILFRRSFGDIVGDRRLHNPEFDARRIIEAVSGASREVREMYEIDDSGFTQRYVVLAGKSVHATH